MEHTYTTHWKSYFQSKGKHQPINHWQFKQSIQNNRNRRCRKHTKWKMKKMPIHRLCKFYTTIYNLCIYSASLLIFFSLIQNLTHPQKTHNLQNQWLVLRFFQCDFFAYGLFFCVFYHLFFCEFLLFSLFLIDEFSKNNTNN